MGELKLPLPAYPLEQYWEMNEAAESRYEYHKGEIWSMAGKSLRHNRIISNLNFTLRNELKKKGSDCEVFTENVLLEVNPNTTYYYPDVMLICDEKDKQEKTTVKNPVLVVEVLSDSSFFMDLSIKLEHYLAMPSLKYYLVIDQSACRVRCFERVGENWVVTIFSNLTQCISLSQLNYLLLNVTEIYENI